MNNNYNEETIENKKEIVDKIENITKKKKKGK